MQNNFFDQKPEFVASNTQDLVNAFQMQKPTISHLKLHPLNPMAALAVKTETAELYSSGVKNKIPKNGRIL